MSVCVFLTIMGFTDMFSVDNVGLVNSLTMLVISLYTLLQVVHQVWLNVKNFMQSKSDLRDVFDMLSVCVEMQAM